LLLDDGQYAELSLAGPKAVLAYLSRYTHRVAISNSRLVSADQRGVTFRWKDYRVNGPERTKTMTLPTHEFIRRFLIHVLPRRFHRIRHYGFLANGNRAANLELARKLLNVPAEPDAPEPEESEPDNRASDQPCPACGGNMVVIETFGPGQAPRRPQSRDPPEAKAA
jgi:hypothetical protein